METIDNGVNEKVDSQVKQPRKYKCVLLNDDYTPAHYVWELLMKIFNFDAQTAFNIMSKVHNEGKAVCGIFSKDVAETKALQVNVNSQNDGHPLKMVVEPL